MMLYVLLVVLLIALICSCIIIYNDRQKLSVKIKIDEQEIRKREQLHTEVAELQGQRTGLLEHITQLSNDLDKKIIEQENSLATLEYLEQTKANEIKQKYQSDINQYEEVFQKEKEKLQNDYDASIVQFNKIVDIVNAATESLRRQQEDEEKRQFYMLQIDEKDKQDFQKLSSWKDQLQNPRILSMLLWQTYIQKPLKILSSRIIGDKVKTGIYKITYVPTGECYVGQAVDVNKRLQEHCKCGCGVDTPAANKLYKAMQKYGIWNFSFELLEECKKEQLNEKEATYIKLFDSVNSGFNTSNGIGKPIEV